MPRGSTLPQTLFGIDAEPQPRERLFVQTAVQIIIMLLLCHGKYTADAGCRAAVRSRVSHSALFVCVPEVSQRHLDQSHRQREEINQTAISPCRTTAKFSNRQVFDLN
jgi:hypothetical protein